MSTTSLTDRDLRQREIVPPEKLAQCHALVIGVGAVGRQVALQLASMGLKRITLVDHDTVEVVNLAPQGYMREDLGRSKVEATADWCRRLNPEVMIECHDHRFARSSPKVLACFEHSEQRLVVLCCVDSITVRSIIWQAVKDRASFFVDGRMNAEVIRVLASSNPPIEEHYPKTLFSQEEAHAGACTARSTIYTASIAAGLMLGQFTRWLRGMAVDGDLMLNLLSAELTVG